MNSLSGMTNNYAANRNMVITSQQTVSGVETISFEATKGASEPLAMYFNLTGVKPGLFKFHSCSSLYLLNHLPGTVQGEKELRKVIDLIFKSMN